MSAYHDSRCCYHYDCYFQAYFDMDEFIHYREGELEQELLEYCYYALRAQYFLQLRQKLESSPDTWQVRWWEVTTVTTTDTYD